MGVDGIFFILYQAPTNSTFSFVWQLGIDSCFISSTTLIYLRASICNLYLIPFVNLPVDLYCKSFFEKMDECWKIIQKSNSLVNQNIVGRHEAFVDHFKKKKKKHLAALPGYK